MSDAQERPVSELVKDLLFWVKRDDLTDGRGPLSTDLRVLAAAALQASEEREQRLRTLCDDYNVMPQDEYDRDALLSMIFSILGEDRGKP